jgi:hypothetical protein
MDKCFYSFVSLFFFFCILILSVCLCGLEDHESPPHATVQRSAFLVNLSLALSLARAYTHPLSVSLSLCLSVSLTISLPKHTQITTMSSHSFN